MGETEVLRKQLEQLCELVQEYQALKKAWFKSRDKATGAELGKKGVEMEKYVGHIMGRADVRQTIYNH